MHSQIPATPGLSSPPWGGHLSGDPPGPMSLPPKRFLAQGSQHRCILRKSGGLQRAKGVGTVMSLSTVFRVACDDLGRGEMRPPLPPAAKQRPECRQLV